MPLGRRIEKETGVSGAGGRKRRVDYFLATAVGRSFFALKLALEVFVGLERGAFGVCTGPGPSGAGTLGGGNDVSVSAPGDGGGAIVGGSSDFMASFGLLLVASNGLVHDCGAEEDTGQQTEEEELRSSSSEDPGTEEFSAGRGETSGAMGGSGERRCRRRTGFLQRYAPGHASPHPPLKDAQLEEQEEPPSSCRLTNTPHSSLSFSSSRSTMLALSRTATNAPFSPSPCLPSSFSRPARCDVDNTCARRSDNSPTDSSPTLQYALNELFSRAPCRLRLPPPLPSLSLLHALSLSSAVSLPPSGFPVQTTLRPPSPMPSPLPASAVRSLGRSSRSRENS